MVAAYPEAAYSSNGKRLAHIITDFLFACGTRSSIRSLDKAGVNAYLYYNRYHDSHWINPDKLMCKADSMIGCGVYHSDELPFVFHTKTFHSKKRSAQDTSISAAYGKYWTNFAKYGDPNGPINGPRNGLTHGHTHGHIHGGGGAEAGLSLGLSATLPVWDAYKMSTDNHIAFADPIVSGVGLLGPICNFWDSLPRQGPYPHAIL